MKRIITLTATIALFCIATASGQIVEWETTYGGPDDEWASCIQQTSDGGYIISGSTGQGYDRDIYLVKIHADGTVEWDSTYGGVSEHCGMCVRQTLDGGYIVASSSGGYPDFNAHLLKTDEDGVVQWVREYGETGSPDELRWIELTDDGGYIAVGYTGPHPLDHDVWLLRFDSEGYLLWDSTYSPGSETDAGSCVKVTSDGGYIIAGYSDRSGNRDIYVLKTDAQGGVVWDTLYDVTSHDQGSSVDLTDDGGYIVAGTVQLTHGNNDGFLLKLDGDGNVVWLQIYEGDDQSCGSVRQMPEGGYVTAGRTSSNSHGGRDMYILRTDPTGTVMWDTTLGGADNDEGYCIELSQEGGYIACGYTRSFGAGERDFYVIKFAEPFLTLTIVSGDTVVAHNDTLCYHVICENHTPDYQSLSFKVNVRLPNGNMYGPIFGPARFGMFGNGISEGDMCHVVPRPAPVGDYWLFAEVYNLEVSARDSMAFTITGDGALANLEPLSGGWQTVFARLGDQDLMGGAAVGLPTEFALHSNYPNPFNASTTISFDLGRASDVKLEVYNIAGQEVETLIDGRREAGRHSISWNAAEVTSGIYFYKLTAAGITETRRMLLVK